MLAPRRSNKEPKHLLECSSRLSLSSSSHSQDQVEISIDIRHDLITAPSTTLCVAKPDGVAGGPCHLVIIGQPMRWKPSTLQKHAIDFW